jgi:hypothetical protein
MLNPKPHLHTFLTGIKLNGCDFMTYQEEYYTLSTAAHYGGNFVTNIAKAGIVADPINRKRIFDAFPEIVNFYGPTTSFYRSHTNSLQ